MRLDYLAATIAADPEDVMGRLEAGLGAQRRQSNGLHGYALGVELVAGQDVAARVLYGGRNARPHAFCSGSASPALDAALRGAYAGRYGVTRLDVCEDFDGPGTWQRLYAPLLSIADERGLAIDQAGDWHRLEAGRTLYLGARTSAVRVRLYEKGKQLRQTGADPSASLDLCRLEVQVRPEGASRYVAAAGAPVDAWGYAVWTREVAARVLGLDVPRVTVKEGRRSDDDRAFAALSRQYAAVLGRMADRTSWDDVAAQLERRVRAQLEAGE